MGWHWEKVMIGFFLYRCVKNGSWHSMGKGRGYSATCGPTGDTPLVRVAESTPKMGALQQSTQKPLLQRDPLGRITEAINALPQKYSKTVATLGVSIKGAHLGLCSSLCSRTRHCEDLLQDIVRI